jgi:hypothetical protein
MVWEDHLLTCIPVMRRGLILHVPFEVSVDQSGTNPIYLLADVRPMTQAERVELKRKGRVIRPQVYIGHLDPRSISPIDALAPISPGQAWGAGRNKP